MSVLTPPHLSTVDYLYSIGAAFCLVKQNKKHPLKRNWQIPESRNNVIRHIENNGSLGLLCGGAFGGIVLLDIDEHLDKFLNVFPELETSPQIVRNNALGKSKFIIQIDGDCTPKKYKGTGKTPVLEILGNGNQGVIIGCHPSGSKYQINHLDAPIPTYKRTDLDKKISKFLSLLGIVRRLPKMSPVTFQKHAGSTGANSQSIEPVKYPKKWAATFLRNQCHRIGLMTDGRYYAAVEKTNLIGACIKAGWLDAGAAEQQLFAAFTKNGAVKKHGADRIRKQIYAGLRHGDPAQLPPTAQPKHQPKADRKPKAKKGIPQKLLPRIEVGKRFANRLNTSRVDIQYISEYKLAIGRHDYLIRSDMGTGKSWAVANIIGVSKIKNDIADIEARIKLTAFVDRSSLQDQLERLNAKLAERESLSVLVVTHRQRLAADTARRFDVASYLNKNGTVKTADELSQLQRLSICANSLPKLISDHRTLPTYDVIIIDEIEQVLGHFGGATFSGSDAETSYNVLKQLLRSSSTVFAMDAHATQVSAEFLLDNNNGRNLSLIDNVYAFNRNELELHEHWSTIISDAIQLASKEDSKPVVLACNNKSDVKIIAAYASDILGHENVMAVHSGNADDKSVKAFVDDINEQIKKYKLLIYSPSLGTGVDIQTPVEAVFGIFKNNIDGVGPDDCHQMLNRCRHRNKTIVWIENKKNSLPTSAKRIFENAVMNTLRTRKAAAIFENGIVTVSDSQKALQGMLSRQLANINKQKNDFFNAFLKLARGYKISNSEFNVTGENDIVIDALKSLRQTQLEIVKELVLTTDPIPTLELQKMQNAGYAITDEMRAGNIRWKIEQITGQTITVESYEELSTGSKRQAIELLRDSLFSEIEQLHAADKNDSTSALHRQKHFTRKALLIRGLFNEIFKTTNLFSLRNVELNEKQLVHGFQKHLAENALDYRLLMPGHRYEPFSDKSKQDDETSHNEAQSYKHLAKILRYVGLTLSRQRRQIDGEKIYNRLLSEKSFNAILLAAQSHEARLKREKEREQLSFTYAAGIDPNIHRYPNIQNEHISDETITSTKKLPKVAYLLNKTATLATFATFAPPHNSHSIADDLLPIGVQIWLKTCLDVTVSRLTWPLVLTMPDPPENIASDWRYAVAAVAIRENVQGDWWRWAKGDVSLEDALNGQT